MTEQDATTTDCRELRDSIDNMDAALVHLLAERFKCTQAVGRLKAEHGMPPADKDREALADRPPPRARPQHSGLDPTFAEEFLNLIIVHVIRSHESIRRDVAG